MSSEEERRASADALYDHAQYIWCEVFRSSTVPNHFANSWAAPVVAGLYKKAAEKGHVKAQYEYAEILQSGIGIKKSEEEAVKWFTKAAMSGDRKSQARLGAAFEKGAGVKSSLAEAYAWYALAASNAKENSYWADYYLKPLLSLKKDLLPLTLANGDARFKELQRTSASHSD